jgi:hypothetical protein
MMEFVGVLVVQPLGTANQANATHLEVLRV